MDKTKIKQLFCNHSYVCKEGDFDAEGKAIWYINRSIEQISKEKME